MSDLNALSLGEVGGRLRSGRLSALELTDRALSSDRHGAYRQLGADLARAQARAADAALRAGVDLGPLHGIPVSVKDLYGVSGFETWAGSRKRLPCRFEEAGPVVRAVLDQLGVITGKTHTVEFAFGGVGTNPHHPTPINPWSPMGEPRAPGGSSSGAGVSLCEGSALVALGTDTAGSVRIPASWTGNVALKTSPGRWSTRGIVPLSPTLDTAGVLARTIEDLVVAFRAIDPRRADPLPAADLQGLRFGRCDELLFEQCSEGVAGAVDEAIAELVEGGVRLRALALPELGPTWELFRLGGPVSIELHHFLVSELPEWLDEIDPNVRARIGDAAQLSAHEYLSRLRAMRERAAAVDARLGEVDVVVSPTVPNTPPRLADVASVEGYGPQNLLCLRNTAMVSYLGLCAVTLPVGKDGAGMPVGLQLFARAGSEERLLAIALACERLLGTGRHRLGEPPPP
ncbi:MAG: amidase [Deltaproteobacteria bacterium]|jgi:aspartyl-tRNA(Asn)/glutamyl-tRNA(Gln) amidotransferase subunit A|nr:amidase [Deltaproteobacteria bacterium]MBW2533465.1 amidase [Deltaproteobacteria bacterium]